MIGRGVRSPEGARSLQFVRDAVLSWFLLEGAFHGQVEDRVVHVLARVVQRIKSDAEIVVAVIEVVFAFFLPVIRSSDAASWPSPAGVVDFHDLKPGRDVSQSGGQTFGRGRSDASFPTMTRFLLKIFRPPGSIARRPSPPANVPRLLARARRSPISPAVGGGWGRHHCALGHLPIRIDPVLIPHRLWIGLERLFAAIRFLAGAGKWSALRFGMGPSAPLRRPPLLVVPAHLVDLLEHGLRGLLLGVLVLLLDVCRQLLTAGALEIALGAPEGVPPVVSWSKNNTFSVLESNL